MKHHSKPISIFFPSSFIQFPLSPFSSFPIALYGPVIVCSGFLPLHPSISFTSTNIRRLARVSSASLQTGSLRKLHSLHVFTAHCATHVSFPALHFLSECSFFPLLSLSLVPDMIFSFSPTFFFISKHRRSIPAPQCFSHHRRPLPFLTVLFLTLISSFPTSRSLLPSSPWQSYHPLLRLVPPAGSLQTPDQRERVGLCGFFSERVCVCA